MQYPYTAAIWGKRKESSDAAIPRQEELKERGYSGRGGNKIKSGE